MIVNRDITDRKRAEEALEEQKKHLEELVGERTAELANKLQELARSNSDLEQFAYVASHDLQEPLRMIASYTQLLAKRYRASSIPMPTNSSALPWTGRLGCSSSLRTSWPTLA